MKRLKSNKSYKNVTISQNNKLNPHQPSMSYSIPHQYQTSLSATPISPTLLPTHVASSQNLISIDSLHSAFDGDDLLSFDIGIDDDIANDKRMSVLTHNRVSIIQLSATKSVKDDNNDDLPKKLTTLSFQKSISVKNIHHGLNNKSKQDVMMSIASPGPYNEYQTPIVQSPQHQKEQSIVVELESQVVCSGDCAILFTKSQTPILNEYESTRTTKVDIAVNSLDIKKKFIRDKTEAIKKQHSAHNIVSSVIIDAGFPDTNPIPKALPPLPNINRVTALSPLEKITSQQEHDHYHDHHKKFLLDNTYDKNTTIYEEPPVFVPVNKTLSPSVPIPGKQLKNRYSSKKNVINIITTNDMNENQSTRDILKTRYSSKKDIDIDIVAQMSHQISNPVHNNHHLNKKNVSFGQSPSPGKSGTKLHTATSVCSPSLTALSTPNTSISTDIMTNIPPIKTSSTPSTSLYMPSTSTYITSTVTSSMETPIPSSYFPPTLQPVLPSHTIISSNISNLASPYTGKNSFISSASSISNTSVKSSGGIHTSHKANVLSTQLSKPNLILTGHSIPLENVHNQASPILKSTLPMLSSKIQPILPTGSFSVSTPTLAADKQKSIDTSTRSLLQTNACNDDCNESKTNIHQVIAQAWPSLNDIVTGYTIEYKNKKKRKMSQIINHHVYDNGKHGSQLSLCISRLSQISHTPIPSINQIGFTYSPNSPENDDNKTSPQRKYQINVAHASPKFSMNMNMNQTVPFGNHDVDDAKDADNILKSINLVKQLINDEEGQTLWLETCYGSYSLELETDDVIESLENYLIENTKCGHLKFTKTEILSYFTKIDNIDNNKLEIITAQQFNNIWKWFKSICCIIKNTYYFWQNSIAKHHGFLTRETAEKTLKKSKITIGTFIIRFNKPSNNKSKINEEYGGLTISFKSKTNNIKHTKLTLLHPDKDIFTNIIGKIRQNGSFFKWINQISRFEYVFNGKKRIPKNKCFI